MRVNFLRLSSPGPRRSAGAFTLVELLVVIGIVALLIGILMPVLSRARAQANRTVCLSNIRQLGTAILMYCNENDGWFPTCADSDDGLAFVPYPDDWIHWQANRDLNSSAIARHLTTGEKLKSLLRCPADTFDGRKTYPGIVPGQGPYMYSYSMNALLAQNSRLRAPSGYRTKINKWRSPSRKILMTEGTGDLPGTYYDATWHYGAPLTRRHGVGRFHKNIPGNSVMRFGAMLGVNVSAVFLDGHADSVDQDLAFDRIHADPGAQ